MKEKVIESLVTLGSVALLGWAAINRIETGFKESYEQASKELNDKVTELSEKLAENNRKINEINLKADTLRIDLVNMNDTSSKVLAEIGELKEAPISTLIAKWNGEKE